MIKVTINGDVLQYNIPPTLEEVAKDAKVNNPLAAKVNKRLRELSYVISSDANVEILSYESSDAIKIYETTLRFVIAKAVHNLYPKAKVRFNYSVSRSILAEIENLPKPLDDEILQESTLEVEKLIKMDAKIERRRVSIGEATRLYKKFNMNDKVEILKYREEEYVNLYECDGYFNYMFGYMLPSTGYLKEFNMFLYNPGFLIQYPRAEENGKIPTFVDEPVFGNALRKVALWGKTIGGNNIAAINKFTETRHDLVDFVNMCEAKHYQQLVELGETIYKNRDDIRLIDIAGPSSSGKTTFSNRLRVELKSRGIKPVMISIDDYYLGKDEAPKNADGSPDLEHIEALDVKLFNKDMAALVRGEKVVLPKFNFVKGKRETGRTIQVAHDEIIIIEGIHALNNLLTQSIPNHQKFKIYIAPQTQLHIDNQNPISITDLRLLRRLVRDQKFRNSSAEDTFDMWPSVRRGEFKWIYPYQKEANFVFNSELTYEFGVLKKHAVAQLRSITPDSKHFITANRLLKFLKYFVDIEDELVPVNSLLREFIGGSSFED